MNTSCTPGGFGKNWSGCWSLELTRGGHSKESVCVTTTLIYGYMHTTNTRSALWLDYSCHWLVSSFVLVLVLWCGPSGSEPNEDTSGKCCHRGLINNKLQYEKPHCLVFVWIRIYEHRVYTKCMGKQQRTHRNIFDWLGAILVYTWYVHDHPYKGCVMYGCIPVATGTGSRVSAACLYRSTCSLILDRLSVRRHCDVRIVSLVAFSTYKTQGPPRGDLYIYIYV